MNNYEQKKGLIIGIVSATLAVILIVVGLAKGSGVSSPVLMTAAVGGVQSVNNEPMGDFNLSTLSNIKKTVNGKTTVTPITTYNLSVIYNNKTFLYNLNLNRLLVTAKGKVQKDQPSFTVIKKGKSYEFLGDVFGNYDVVVTPVYSGKVYEKAAKRIKVAVAELLPPIPASAQSVRNIGNDPAEIKVDGTGTSLGGVR